MKLELHLDEKNSAPNVCEFFALVLAEVGKVWREGAEFIPQGTLLRGWGVPDGFRLEDLLGSCSNIYWPEPIKEAHRITHSGNSPAVQAMLRAIEQYRRDFGVDNVQEGRIMAAVAQTLRPVADKEGKKRQQDNRSLAEGHIDAAYRRVQNAAASTSSTRYQPQQPAQPPLDLSVYERRLDEQGAKVIARGLTLWHASHRGPAHAGKLKNQDATFALETKGGIVFALADGVSTSMGSRLAAAVVVKEFCESLATGQPSLSPKQRLHDAAAKAQAPLDRLLAMVEASPATNQFNDLYDGLQPPAVKRILENTRTRKNRGLTPAFATTLLGGFVHPTAGGYQVHFICIGDGVVEWRDRQGKITAVIAMDNQETAISATICPGVLGQESLRRAVFETCHLTSGDHLLISSDGLTRGHQQSVWAQLNDIWAFQEVASDSEHMAWRILDQACGIADARSEEPRLFGDNLSLLLLTVQ